MRGARLLAAVLALSAAELFADIDTAAYCSAIRQCMNASDYFCNAENSRPNPDIEYDGEFCRPMHAMRDRDVRPATPDGRAVFSLMGKRYRSVYDVTGELPVNMEILNYVLDNLPFVAMLVNAYQGEAYEARYLTRDRRVFHGGNGRSLSGTFAQPYHQTTRDSVRNFYWGYGRAKVLAWRLKGDGLLEMDFYNRGPRRVEYRLRAYAFPGNAFLNGVMQMGIFRNMVLKKIRIVIDDVERSARRFADGDLEPIRGYEPMKSRQGQRYLREFQEIVHRSGYLDSLTILIDSHADSLATPEKTLRGQTIRPDAGERVEEYPDAGPVPLPAPDAPAGSRGVSSAAEFFGVSADSADAAPEPNP